MTMNLVYIIGLTEIEGQGYTMRNTAHIGALDLRDDRIEVTLQDGFVAQATVG